MEGNLMHKLKCGCSVDVQHHETESATVLLAVKVVKWCALHSVVSVLLLGGEGSCSLKKKEAKTK
jgi:hypothetical protein